MTGKIRIAFVAAIALLTGCAGAPQFEYQVPTPTANVPEGASGYAEKPGWTAKKFMISAANPLATDAGYQILRSGGSAIDAAIATQMVLNLVEPQSSGIGGGALLMYFDGKVVTAFDGRETAPATATDRLFQGPDGKSLGFFQALVGGRSVGTPGVLRMLELAHERHGRMTWASLFDPAIALAERGFAVSPRLHALLDADRYLKGEPIAAAYFYDKSGKPWPIGHILKNPELAGVLREVAARGADAFYTGKIARDIEASVKSHPTNPGGLSASDFARYRAKIRDPICTDYKVWTVCGMPPPSSGGIAVAQILGILESKEMARFAPINGEPGADAVHLFSEAGRLAFADRARYIADPDFITLPGYNATALLDKVYLAQRAASIGDKSIGTAKSGTPPGISDSWGRDTSPDLPSTTHVSIVDGFGNAVSMTSTIENAFGSRVMVRGFLLNNQLTDFSFDAVDADGPIANRVQAGKRPRSSMAPAFVFDRGTRNLVMVIGSPGGPSIINYVAKALIGTLEWGMSMQQAINLPNFGSRNGPTELEQGRAPQSIVKELEARGHSVRTLNQTSGLQGIMRVDRHGESMWFGGADPRREGDARGD